MDLIKIGRYIAEKRKGLGLTQRQVAEKLGMSDKSVSKWERGICLPDVSVYIELCAILGISINEFLAGEDINENNLIQKSEDNLIQLTKDSRHKQKRLKTAILVLVMITAISLILNVFHNLDQPQNYITAVNPESAEMKTAELLSGIDGAFMFKYFSKEKFESLTLFMSEYHSGKLISKDKAAELSHEDTDAASEGMIVLIPDFDNFTVKLIVTDNCAKYSTTLPVLKNVSGREYYGRSASQIESNTSIHYNSEQGLLALLYGKDELNVIPIQEMEDDDILFGNDYVYYLSFEFCK